MRKSLLFLSVLIMVLALALAACGGDTAPASEESAAGEPAAEESAADEPEAEEPVAEEPVAEDPEAEEPAAEEPEAEVVTLDYYWIGNGDTDQRAAVEAAINEYVEPLIGVNVVFHIIGWGDWETKALTGIQAGEKMDVFFTADWREYMYLASQDLFTPLNDDAGPNGNLLEEYGQDILSTLSPAFITGTQIDGVNYAVPTNKELTVPMGLLYNAAFAEEIGLTPEEAAKIETMRDLEPWLEAAKEARPDEYPYLYSGEWWGFEPWLPSLSSDIPGNVINMKMVPDADGNFDETIYSMWETDVNEEYATMMREWYEKDWIFPDSYLTTYEYQPDLNAGAFLFTTNPLKGNNIKAQEMMNASGNDELVLLEIYGQPKVNVTHHAGGSMLAIPTVSDNPAQAMQFLNLMHSDPTLINTMLFGVEGEHWEFEDDGRVNILDAAWTGAHAGAWTIGNTQLQAVSNVEDPEKNAMLISYSDDSVAHPSLGFRFRTEPVAAELTAIRAVVDGMSPALYSGAVDPAVEIPNYLEQLEAAGLETVMAEVQAQYDAWKLAKGE